MGKKDKHSKDKKGDSSPPRIKGKWREEESVEGDEKSSVPDSIMSDHKDDDKNISDGIVLHEAIDDIESKRTSTRITGLQKLREIFQHLKSYDEIDSVKMSLLETLLNIAHKGEGDDALLSLEVCSLLCLCVPRDKVVCDQISVTLKDIIQGGDDPSVRAQAITCMATAIFFHNSDDSLDFQNTLEEILQGERGEMNDDVIISTCKSWGLLLSNEPASYLCDEACNMCLKPLYSILLHHPEYTVRLAAGQLTALIFEGRNKCGLINVIEGEYDEDVPVTIEELIISFPRIINDLAKENSKHHARSDRVNQRKMFRNIFDTSIICSEICSETLTVDGSVYKFEGWSQISQLGFLRHILGEGLPIHISNNNIIRDVFIDAVKSSSSAGHSMADRSATEITLKKVKHVNREKGRDIKLAYLGDESL